MATTLIKNIKKLYGIAEKATGFKKGAAMKEVDSLDNAYLFFDTKIIDFGSMQQCPETADRVVDAKEGMVMPAWCDSHSHIVFAGSREKEFVMRLKGKTYEEIAQAGGGILNSAEKLQKTGFDELFDSAFRRLTEVIKTGTGAIEIKSGYGLSFESEIKMLQVIQKLKEKSDTIIKATFLGAHAIPKAFAERRSAYIRIITDEMLPYIAENQLADYCDVFCDEGFYTVEETDIILKRASEFGLKPKIHANELALSGGVQVGIKNKAVTVDHLERIGEAEIIALLNSETIPTVLPNVSFFLDIPYAPCREMIDRGLGIALASDYNPGSSPSGNIPLLMSIGCHQMKLLPEEAFNAVTINGAYAMEVHAEAGTIERQKKSNIILTDKIPDLSYLMYHFGSNHVQKVWLQGKEQ